MEDAPDENDLDPREWIILPNGYIYFDQLRIIGAYQYDDAAYLVFTDSAHEGPNG